MNATAPSSNHRHDGATSEWRGIYLIFDVSDANGGPGLHLTPAPEEVDAGLPCFRAAWRFPGQSKARDWRPILIWSIARIVYLQQSPAVGKAN
jgi:hypothetical protein